MWQKWQLDSFLLEFFGLSLPVIIPPLYLYWTIIRRWHTESIRSCWIRDYKQYSWIAFLFCGFLLFKFWSRYCCRLALLLRRTYWKLPDSLRINFVGCNCEESYHNIYFPTENTLSVSVIYLLDCVECFFSKIETELKENFVQLSLSHFTHKKHIALTIIFFPNI